MEIKIKEPTRFYCGSCGYREDGMPFSYPDKCPSCGKEGDTHSGFKRLPVNSVYKDSEPRQYSLGGDKTIQFYFRSVSGKQLGVSIDPDYADDIEIDPDDPIAVAEEVQSVYNRLYISSRKKDISEIIEEMKSCKPVSDLNYAKNKVEELRAKIADDYRTLCQYEMEIEETESES